MWDRFARISEIPRPSKNEGKIAAHVIELARKHDFEVRQDNTGNVVVRKAASPGKAGSQWSPLKVTFTWCVRRIGT